MVLSHYIYQFVSRHSGQCEPSQYHLCASFLSTHRTYTLLLHTRCAAEQMWLMRCHHQRDNCQCLLAVIRAMQTVAGGEERSFDKCLIGKKADKVRGCQFWLYLENGKCEIGQGRKGRENDWTIPNRLSHLNVYRIVSVLRFTLQWNRHLGFKGIPFAASL